MGKVGGYIDGGIDGKHVLQAEGGGDFPQLHSRDREAYFTLHFILISRTTAWENTLSQTHSHIQTNNSNNVCQILPNPHTSARSCKQLGFLHVNVDKCT